MRYATLTGLLLALAMTACDSSAPESTATHSAAKPTHAASTLNLSETLPAYHWQLETATDSQGQTAAVFFVESGERRQPLQLDFADEHLSIATGCNRLGGNYSAHGPQLQIKLLMQTQMACSPELMARERAASQWFGEQTLAVSLEAGEAPLLSLRHADGSQLHFRGQATPETRYGGPGERVFLEVQAQRIDCSHPLMPDYRCLNVREVHYDENGIRTGTGDWQALYQDIEGYEHQPGIRNVLRLKRFTVPNPPADASSMAYVLDMIVESEVIQPDN